MAQAEISLTLIKKVPILNLGRDNYLSEVVRGSRQSLKRNVWMVPQIRKGTFNFFPIHYSLLFEQCLSSYSQGTSIARCKAYINKRKPCINFIWPNT